MPCAKMDSKATKLLWKKFTEIFQQKSYSKRQHMWDFLLLLNKSIQILIFHILPTQFRDNFFGFELQNCQGIVLQQGLLMMFQGRNFDGLITTSCDGPRDHFDLTNFAQKVGL